MRQRIRKTTLLISLLLFPITMWYFSPYIIISAAMEHVINGSFIVFAAMLVFSMFFGRVWCGYLCPAGGLQECALRINAFLAESAAEHVLWDLMSKDLWLRAKILNAPSVSSAVHASMNARNQS